MKTFLVILAALGSVFSISSVRGQSLMEPPPYGPTHIGGPEPPDRVPYPRTTPAIRRPKQEDRVLKKGLLAPSVQDRTDNATFLRQPETGLIKLLPREVFDWRTYHTEKRLNAKGGGAYYSFFNLSHDTLYGADLELDHNNLSVGLAGDDYGMLTNLGNVPLNEISANDRRVAFMATYDPARKVPNARCEMKRFRDGVTLEGALYRSLLPVRVNSTYLLRSINYGRSDLLVGFQIVRQQPDGSVTIAWKSLRRYGRPRFEPVFYVNAVDKCPNR